MRNLIETVSKHSLKKFYQLHKGEECYIFGTGPSIKWMDFKYFANKDSIVTGLIPLHKDFYTLNTRYYCLIEPWLFVDKFTRYLMGISKEQDSMITNQSEIVLLYKQFIKKNKEIEIFVNSSNMLNINYLWESKVNFILQNLPEENPIISQLNNFQLFAGSFHAPIVLAYFMGYRQINLVGFDAWVLRKSRRNRFFEIGEGEISLSEELDDGIINILESECKINVISPSEDYSDSILKNNKTIFYEDLFSTKATYRENIEIVSNENLKSISSDPSLNVY